MWFNAISTVKSPKSASRTEIPLNTIFAPESKILSFLTVSKSTFQFLTPKLFNLPCSSVPLILIAPPEINCLPVAR